MSAKRSTWRKAMRKMILVTGLFIGFAALVAYSRAQADEPFGPPPAGWAGSFHGTYIICNTEDQIKQIAEAGKDDNADLQEAFKMLYETPDANKEPTCIVGPVIDVVVGESKELGLSRDAKNNQVKAWSVHIGNPSGHWFILYADRPKAPQGSSI
jgi:hypothetical protein